MPMHESGQMYLKAMYVLLQSKEKIRAIDIGTYLGYAKHGKTARSILRNFLWNKKASLPSVENYVIMREKENDAYDRKSRKTI